MDLMEQWIDRLVGLQLQQQTQYPATLIALEETSTIVRLSEQLLAAVATTSTAAKTNILSHIF
jgi:hypothetical protein